MNSIRRGLKRKEPDRDGEEYQAGLTQFQVQPLYPPGGPVKHFAQNAMLNSSIFLRGLCNGRKLYSPSEIFFPTMIYR